MTGSGTGGRIAAVEPESPAARAGIAAGETLLSVDGHTVTDVLDWQWRTAAEQFLVRVADRRGAERDVAIERSWEERVGIEFVDALFDGVRTCGNACTFCFVRQLPPGMRESLYVRDDDYRLSFLLGNFITLTNVTDSDVERIVDQRLSPLYVSLHATDPDVRRRLVCPTGPDEALARLDALLAGGIDVHVQIVLVPEVNDGDALQRTLEWLSRRERVASVGVVPLGYTRYQERFARSYEDPNASAGLLGALEPWRALMKAERGVRWVYGADEFYLHARAQIPTADDYDGFPQYENGIGLVRGFLDDVGVAGTTVPVTRTVPATLLAGTLFAPVLRRAVADARMRDVGVLAVENRFFGGDVSVTGLLTASDILAALAAQPVGGVFLVPDVILNADGVTLDDVAGSELAERSGRDVRVVSSNAAGLLESLRTLSSDPDGR